MAKIEVPINDLAKRDDVADAEYIAELAAAFARADTIRVERDALRTENQKLKDALRKAAVCLYDLANTIEMTCHGA